MIATHNRKDDLARTCHALEALRPLPSQVIIAADGCTDGTVAFIRESYPAYRLIVNDTSQGSIACRDRMIRECECEVVLSLDDDSHPVEPNFLEVVAETFAKNSRLAVATFPQRSDEFPETLDVFDFGPPLFVGSYTSSGAAVRRSIFLELGGYPERFRHAYEEPDFALRVLAAGYQVRMETDLSVRHHYTGVQRNEIRTHHFHARNELWSVLMRCPASHVVPVALFRALRQFGYACKRGPKWALREPQWWISFCAGLGPALQARKAIPWPLYRAWMELLRHPIQSQQEWDRRFGFAPGEAS